MNRHLIVITFLEWLNWNAKGTLRVAPGRLIWCSGDAATGAVLGSLRLAPDLEPADDSFLLAEVNAAPSDAGFGNLLLPLKSTRFEALCERSTRLLEPSAKRMAVDLALAAEDIREVWRDWKDAYRLDIANQQARRIWSWAWGHPWSFSAECREELLLREAQQIENELKEVTIENASRLDPFIGTTAESWVRMILAADRSELLAPEKDALWRNATNAYILSCKRAGRLGASFLPMSDKTFSDALNSLPLNKPEMVKRLAVATGEHHALRLTAGQVPDPSALLADIQTLVELPSSDTPDTSKGNASTALLVLGRSMPGAAIIALLQSSDIIPGWLNRLFEESDLKAKAQIQTKQNASDTAQEIGSKGDNDTPPKQQFPACTTTKTETKAPEPSLVVQVPMQPTNDRPLINDELHSGGGEVASSSVDLDADVDENTPSPSEAKMAGTSEVRDLPAKQAPSQKKSNSGKRKRTAGKSLKPSDPELPLDDNQ